MTDPQRDEGLPRRAQEELSSASEEVQRGAREVAHESKRRARELAREGKREARSLLDEQKEAASFRMRDLAEALNSSANELESQGRAGTSAHLSRVARGMERFSESLSEKDVDDLVGEAEELARKQPVAVFGLAASAGFVLSRFLKASGERRLQRSSPAAAEDELTPQPGTSRTHPLSSPSHHEARDPLSPSAGSPFDTGSNTS